MLLPGVWYWMKGNVRVCMHMLLFSSKDVRFWSCAQDVYILQCRPMTSPHRRLSPVDGGMLRLTSRRPITLVQVITDYLLTSPSSASNAQCGLQRRNYLPVTTGLWRHRRAVTASNCPMATSTAGTAVCIGKLRSSTGHAYLTVKTIMPLPPKSASKTIDQNLPKR